MPGMTDLAPAQGGPDREALADLLQAVAGGDRAAFAALFRRFAPRLRSYMMRLGADPGTADELTQETMLIAWRRAATFDRRQSSVGTWLFTIARNKRIDAIRRDRRPDFDPNDPALVPEPPEAADAALDAAEREARVRRAMRSLPGEQIELLRLAFYDGLSHRDIAERTGLPLGTVKSRLRLAFGHMRRLVGRLD
jgi:RNA polymerase sigma-70 factor (ECF subfamily)